MTFHALSFRNSSKGFNEYIYCFVHQNLQIVQSITPFFHVAKIEMYKFFQQQLIVLKHNTHHGEYLRK